MSSSDTDRPLPKKWRGRFRSSWCCLKRLAAAAWDRIGDLLDTFAVRAVSIEILKLSRDLAAVDTVAANSRDSRRSTLEMLVCAKSLLILHESTRPAMTPVGAAESLTGDTSAGVPDSVSLSFGTSSSPLDMPEETLASSAPNIVAREATLAKAEPRLIECLIDLLDSLDSRRENGRAAHEELRAVVVRRIEQLAECMAQPSVASGFSSMGSADAPPWRHAIVSLRRWALEESAALPPASFFDAADVKALALAKVLGLERIQSTGAFDVSTQYIMQMIDTDELSLDQTIAETVECGYRWRDRPVRPQRVFVYRFKGSSVAQQ